MKKIILIGAGGHAKSCIDVIESLNKKFKIAGLIEKYNTNDVDIVKLDNLNSYNLN